jgi:PilZ domain
LPSAESRGSERVPYRASLHVATPRGNVQARLLDLSRTGLALQVGLADLGPRPPRDLYHVASWIGQTIGRSFRVEINPEALGSLLAREVHVVRIGGPEDGSDDVVLGCTFVTPLSDLETVMLGVPLPRPRGGGETWLPRADVPMPYARDPGPMSQDGLGEGRITAPAATATAAPDGAVPARLPDAAPIPEDATPQDLAGTARSGHGVGLGWRAQISGAQARVEPLPARAERVNARGAVVLVSRRAPQVQGVFDARDVVDAIVEFTKRFGQELVLKLMDGPRHRWTGPTRLAQMSLPEDNPAHALLDLRFARPPRAAELRQLGLKD